VTNYPTAECGQNTHDTQRSGRSGLPLGECEGCWRQLGSSHALETLLNGQVFTIVREVNLHTNGPQMELPLSGCAERNKKEPSSFRRYPHLSLSLVEPLTHCAHFVRRRLAPLVIAIGICEVQRFDISEVQRYDNTHETTKTR